MSQEKLCYEATTIYDEAAYRALTRLMLRKLRRTPRFLLLGLSILLISTGGWDFFKSGGLTLRSSLLLLFGNCLMIFSLLAEHFLVRLFMAENKPYNKLINLYQFYNDHMDFSNDYSKDNIPYTEFNYLLESEGYLFLFVKDKQAYILRKSEIRKDTAENLCTFLDHRIAACKAATSS